MAKKAAAKTPTGRTPVEPNLQTIPVRTEDGKKIRQAANTRHVEEIKQPQPINYAEHLRTCVENNITELGAGVGALLDRPLPDTAAGLAQLYGAYRDLQESLKKAVEPLDDAITKLGSELIPQAFDVENIKSFTTQDGYRVTVSQKYFVSIKKENREDAYEWLKSNGLGDLIQPTVNASTLSAAGKKMLEEGFELPEELFAAHFQAGTSLTRTGRGS